MKTVDVVKICRVFPRINVGIIRNTQKDEITKLYCFSVVETYFLSFLSGDEHTRTVVNNIQFPLQQFQIIKRDISTHQSSPTAHLIALSLHRNVHSSN